MRPPRATAILAALPLVLLTATPSHAEGVRGSAASIATNSDTGGYAYEPLPSRASPVNSGTLPGDSGGASYDPSLLRHESRPKGRRRSAVTPVPASTPASLLSARDHSFPVLGAHSFGGADARFGAGRPGHIHQGQDILAAQGTPVVAPRGGTISWRAFQAQGAGYYLVLNAVDEPFTYVFMHLERGSLVVGVGARVRTGQQIAAVGATGTASAPHLHFEIWDGPWYHGGHPIDPLPALMAWQRGS